MTDRPTPYLQVDLDVLEANLAEMASFTADHGLALRPHAKTHKSAEIAARQLAGGAVGLTVATLAEAEVFTANGADDLFLAYPLWVDPAKGERLRALAERARLTIGIDSVESGRALAAQVPGAAVLVEVDSGQHRSGVVPAEAGVLAESAQHAGLDVRGVFTFPGHSYAPAAMRDVAGQESRALAEAAASLREHDVEPVVVSGGSTPSAHEADASVLTEVRPGVYVFNDAQQWELGVATPDRLALCAVGTVVSHAGGRVVLDTGSKVCGADRAAYASGFGRLLDHPDARIPLQAEHHAVVEWPDDERPPLGSRLRVVPNHVCVAVNLVDELVVVRGSDPEPVDVWRVAARGANA
jgi:D-serine deaminase-like pyridoxal phosphate-dependent protein